MCQLAHRHPYNRTAEYEHCTTDRQGTHCPEWAATGDLNASPLPTATTKRGCNFGLSPKKFDAEIVAAYFQPGFVMSAKETLAPHQITKWDALSVTMQFTEQGQEEGESRDARGGKYSSSTRIASDPTRFVSILDVISVCR
jgi:hypothetical protein